MYSIPQTIAKAIGERVVLEAGISAPSFSNAALAMDVD
jgi:hypothetical protein